ncbi:MAG: 4Fe-4S dicluster domain-containing protein, partial [Candidatus Bathyarchaeia archaeon]
VAVDKLAVLIVYDERSKTSLADLRSGIENALSLLVEARERIPKAGPRVSLEELGTVLVPEVDSEYADLVELKPLAGFGIVEWDGKRCLGCNSCPEICPEASLSLKPVWDASTVFEMTEDEMEEMPESRRMIYQSMRRIALRKPTEPIKLPEETLGFGEVDYNLIKCIACGRCEKRCPNKAIAVREIWNFSEVMRILTQR